MSRPVTVLDYGIGNLLNVVRALEHCGAAVTVRERGNACMAGIERLVLPGVGAFGDGMAELSARGLDDLVKGFALTGRPILGICVGLQMMFEASEEMGEHAGLGLLPGRVKAVPARGTDGQRHRIPHIGWRALESATQWRGTILADVPPGERVYFVHSFAAEPAQASDRLADVHYDGVRICAAAYRDNLYGCQFHPERSASTGLSVPRRFLAL